MDERGRRWLDEPPTRDRFLGAAAGTGFAAALGLAGLAPVRAAVGGSRPGPGRMIERLAYPLDLETPTRYFDRYLTPNEYFFVRSHFGAPPAIDPAAWRLSVHGHVRHPLSLSLTDLKRLPEVSVVATIQCSGNGRAYFQPHPAGVQWQRGAVGTARWTGVRLADVLRRAGVGTSGRHVWLLGRDKLGPQVPRFQRAIPLAKALAPETILAYAMSGEPLPLLHGQPLRLIVPGWVADDQVKWLEDIQVQPDEPPGFYYQTAYRYPNTLGKPGVAVPPAREHPLTVMNVKSLIALPEDGATVGRGAVMVQGVAWSGETEITQVIVSIDGGHTWRPAHLGRESTPYSWRLWSLPVRFDRPGAHAVMARATDGRGASQPFTSPWNPSGYLWNAVDTVRVTVR